MAKYKNHDEYIAAAPEYARPILTRVRQQFHKAHPGIQEEIKWGVPSFTHKGIVANMAAMKAHVVVAFWKNSLLADPKGYLKGRGDKGMGGLKLTSEKDLPPEKELVALIRQAVKLNEDGVAPAKKQKPAPESIEPDYMTAAIRKNKDALKHWKAFTPGKKREYILWITEAKQDATREKRLKQAVEWISEGKPRNWKYMNC